MGDDMQQRIRIKPWTAVHWACSTRCPSSYFCSTYRETITHCLNNSDGSVSPADVYSQTDFHTKDSCSLGQVFVLVPCHMINNRCKVGGSIQLNRLKALMVSFEDPLHAITVRVLDVAILRKTKAKHEQYSNKQYTHIILDYIIRILEYNKT